MGVFAPPYRGVSTPHGVVFAPHLGGGGWEIYPPTFQILEISLLESSYHLATCTLQACDAETNSKVAENHTYHSTTMSARAAVNKYNPISYIFLH